MIQFKDKYFILSLFSKLLCLYLFLIRKFEVIDIIIDKKIFKAMWSMRFVWIYV